MQTILASASPRRKELLSLLINDFNVLTSDIDESTEKSLPHEIVKDLAQKKALAVKKLAKDDDLIISADTLVFLNKQRLGKPRDVSDAKYMLSALSNKTHSVYTGFCLIFNDKILTDFERTDVTFNPLTDEEIDAYIATLEPMDKAGAYGIQGYASRFIKKIDGCYFNVVGLPISKLYNSLREFCPSALTT